MTTTPTCDVIVIGLGAAGGAAAGALARRGATVLGLDRHTPPHTQGSHHGDTRVIREAYFEHPVYVPLVQQAAEMWRELEEGLSEPLLRRTGGLMLGVNDGILVAGSVLSAERHGLLHERIDAGEVRRRYPALAPADGMTALFEPRTGVLFVESCVRAQLNAATAAGAELHYDEPVVSWSAGGGGVTVETGRGRYSAGRLLLAAGAWMGPLVTALAPRLSVERQVLYWLQPDQPALFGPPQLPVFIIEFARERFIYGIPDLGSGLKVGRHHEGEICSADDVRREPDGGETAALRDRVRRYLPQADGRLLRSSVCLYTNTPDGHFVLDYHPEHPQVLLASPCSGHGFKFAPVLGRICAELLLDGSTSTDLSMFRLDRFSPAGPGAGSPGGSAGHR